MVWFPVLFTPRKHHPSAAAVNQNGPGQLPVSSVFFMLLPEQVYVYGDCASTRIRPQNSWQKSRFSPQIPCGLRYRTARCYALLLHRDFCAGSDVEKVREATRLAQEKRLT